MSSLHRALLALAVVGAILTALGVALVLNSDYVDEPAISAAIGGLIMSTYIGVGLYAWWRRPANRFGTIMAATGFAAFFQALTAANASLFFTIGVAFGTVYYVMAVHMLLAFPTGQIPTRAQRRIVVGAYVLTTVGPLLMLMTSTNLEADEALPDNAFLVEDLPDVYRALDVLTSIVGVALVGAVAVILFRRWRATGPRDRPALAPFLFTGAAMVALLAVLLAVDSVTGQTLFLEIVNLGALAAFALLPFTFLAGLRRSRAWRAGAVTELVASLGGGHAGPELRDALAEALGDPDLQVAYWITDHYVDDEGQTLPLPGAGEADRTHTVVERDGRRVGALVHDVALCDEPELITAVAAAAALALDNERLSAELRARIEELRRSRQRLLEIGMAERRRLERDLHDGAQQRLVSLSLQLGLVSQQLDRGAGGSESARELLDGARTEARSALEDLRELARGIHPAVLTDRGLGPALEALAERAPLPVEVELPPELQLPAPVEAAAYFVVSESLTNVAKYAQAGHAEVRVSAEHGWALVEVRDDGVGGADVEAGSGLRGMAERLAALDGRLEIESEPGRGTAIRARVPCIEPVEVRQ